jgi:transcription-repair coupling factor (superfamily II helicase)
MRLSLYKRLASTDRADKIDAMLEELVDRFGKLPAQAQTLFDLHRLRIQAKVWGVQKIEAAPGVISIHFRPNPPIDPMKIIELVQKNRHIKLAGNDKLRIERAWPDPKDRAQAVRDVFRMLGTPQAPASAPASKAAPATPRTVR